MMENNSIFLHRVQWCLGSESLVCVIKQKSQYATKRHWAVFQHACFKFTIGFFLTTLGIQTSSFNLGCLNWWRIKLFG